MELHLLEFIRMPLAVCAGALVGYSFGLLQAAATRRHQRLQQLGQLRHGWSILPSSGRRVAYLLFALVLVQLLCPLLFSDGAQWCVSLGVVGGYGVVLYQQLRLRMSGRT